MTWENEEPEDQNLEELRKTFSLENITTSKVLIAEPDVEDLEQGQFRLFFNQSEGKLYLYSKYGNNLYRVEMGVV